jgi:hypothetical protein
MLQSLKKLYRDKLGALDGEIGHINDFYFDDQNWAVRYLVADTGSWLPGRQVLLSPHAFGNSLREVGKDLVVNLTRKQIEGSPSIDTHKPVSRQYEEEYYRYYGWPYYWQGDGLWGMSGSPILELPPNHIPGKAAAGNPRPKRPDAHLRSTQSVNGYRLQASDGIAGHVCDFMMDTQSWAICQLVIKVGHRFSGEEVPISVGHVDRISYEESTVFASLTKEAVEKSSASNLTPVARPIGDTRPVPIL